MAKLSRKQRKMQRKVPKLVEKHREAHNDKYVWDAIPLCDEAGKDRIFATKIDPYSPARLRDGRPAYIIEINPVALPFERVVVEVPNTLPNVNDEFILLRMSLEGNFRMDKSPCPLDLINVSPRAWNAMYERGKLPFPCFDWDTT